MLHHELSKQHGLARLFLCDFKALICRKRSALLEFVLREAALMRDPMLMSSHHGDRTISLPHILFPMFSFLIPSESF